MELPPTGLGTATAVGWTTLLAAGAEYAVAGAAAVGGGGGGEETTTEDGSDAQPAKRPTAPQTAKSASDGDPKPSRTEIFVFILSSQTRVSGSGSLRRRESRRVTYPMRPQAQP